MDFRTIRPILVFVIPLLCWADGLYSVEHQDSQRHRRRCVRKILSLEHRDTFVQPIGTVENLKVVEHDPKLSHSGRERQSIHELDYAGYRVPNRRALKDLEDGVYIYLIDEFGDIYLSSRVPDLSLALSEQFFATHRSLLNIVSGLTPMGDKIEIFAAGEFEIRNGKPYAINNKAGTFRKGNNQDHLYLAVSTFLDHGLDFSTGKMIDISRQQPRSDGKIAGLGSDHLQEEEEARLRIEIHQNPKMRMLRQRYKNSMRRIFDLFPTPRGQISDELSGHLAKLAFSWDPRIPKLMGLKNIAVDSENYIKEAEAYLWFLHELLGYAENDSPEWMLTNFPKVKMFQNRFGNNVEEGITALLADLEILAKWIKDQESSK